MTTIKANNNVAGKWIKASKLFRGVIRVVDGCFYAELSPFPFIPRRGKVGVLLKNTKGRYIRKERISEYKTHWLVWTPTRNWWKMFFNSPKTSIMILLHGFGWI